MVSGRVERVEPDEWETVGSLDQHKSAFVGWESSAYLLKLHPRISTAKVEKGGFGLSVGIKSVNNGIRRS